MSGGMKIIIKLTWILICFTSLALLLSLCMGWQQRWWWWWSCIYCMRAQQKCDRPAHWLEITTHRPSERMIKTTEIIIILCTWESLLGAYITHNWESYHHHRRHRHRYFIIIDIMASTSVSPSLAHSSTIYALRLYCIFVHVNTIIIFPRYKSSSPEVNKVFSFHFLSSSFSLFIR